MSGQVGQNQLKPFPSPVPPWSDTMGPVIVRGNDNVTAAAFNAHDADATIHLQSSTISAQPVPGTPGRLWLTTDTGQLWQDTGTGWTLLNPAALAASVQVASADVIDLLSFAMRRINFLEQAMGAEQIIDAHLVPSAYSLIEEDSQWT